MTQMASSFPDQRTPLRIHEHMAAQGYMGWVREVVSEVALWLLLLLRGHRNIALLSVDFALHCWETHIFALEKDNYILAVTKWLIHVLH